MKVTANKYLFFVFMGSTVFMELIQFLFYEECIAFLGIDLLFMSFVGLFLCCQRLLLILLSALTIFEVAETISFMAIGNGLDFQALNNANMGFAWGLFKHYVLLALAACALIYLGLRSVYLHTERNKSFAGSKNITVSLPPLAVLALAITSFSLFYMKEYYTFFPFYSPFDKPWPESVADPAIEGEMLQDMEVSLNAKLNVTKEPDVKRNLVVIVMESIEKLCVGRFNPNARYMMPFVSSVSEVSPTFLGESQKYTDYSVAGMFAAMCGYPFIKTPTLKGDDSPIYRTKKVKCVWDCLGAAGYKMYAKPTDWSFECGNMGKLMEMHGVVLEPEKKYTHDFDLYERSLASIKRHMKEGTPFMYMVLNLDTHFPYKKDPSCNSSDKDHYKPRRVINCLDHNIKLMFAEFTRMKIWETTDIVLYGDHLNFWKLNFYRKQKRETFLTFPKLQDLGKGASVEPKQGVIYDIGPSVLDMLGFEYTPKYPFGRSLFRPGYEKRVPSSVHMRHFYEAVRDEIE